ncbi:GNAT family N-acetyltransferase [Metabacillus litoralis]|uniref:GNAT family N-acetyltransferase n=1 Tax=Metabacillus litoralis TaxID=152268 RepID=UPI000EF626B7|nr:GNAT family N-acetyltransferase [Metabacillus litoralis]
MKIRAAEIRDVIPMSRVHIDSWKTTYNGLLSDKYLESLSYKKKEQLWKQVIPNGGVFVAENESGDIIGFASGGKERTGNYDQFKGELYAIYLLDQYQRKGIGRKLFKAVVHFLQVQHIDSLVVWVVEGNKSCLFYEAIGGIILDSTEVEIGGAKVKEILYGWNDIKYL